MVQSDPRSSGGNLPVAFVGLVLVLLVGYGGTVLAERGPSLMRGAPAQSPALPPSSAPSSNGHTSPSGKPLPRLDELKAWRGSAIYQEHCVSCHGPRGKVAYDWKRQNADDTFPPPPHDSSGHTWHHSDAELFDIVKRGGKIYEDPGFKSAMPAFGGRLKPDEIVAVLTYIKSLWGPEELAAQAEVSLGKPFPKR